MKKFKDFRSMGYSFIINNQAEEPSIVEMPNIKGFKLSNILLYRAALDDLIVELYKIQRKPEIKIK